MKEHDYIIVSELTRYRMAAQILSGVAASNVSEALGHDDDGPIRAQHTHILHCIDTFVARLEQMAGYMDRDKEPWRREWPTECP